MTDDRFHAATLHLGAAAFLALGEKSGARTGETASDAVYVKTMHGDSKPTPEADAATDSTAAAKAQRRRTASGLPPRRRLDAADAREAILAAAEALLVASGPEALRLTEIAGKAGVSHPNVLYHFGSVAELQRQLAQRVAIRLAGEIGRVFAGGEKARMPIDRAIAAVFAVFDEVGYARLLAWLALSQNDPKWDALGSNLAELRIAIEGHPALRGDENLERRRRVVSVMELVIVSAVGYGLIGHTVEGLFAPDPLRPSAGRLLSELLLAVNRPSGERA